MSHRLSTLANGLKVVTVPRPGTDTVTVFVLVKVGSRYEPVAWSGISHFIEHMMFKGTTTRPTTQDISQELDAVGADYNAFTSKDWTGYYIKVSTRHAALAVDVLADMIWSSVDNEADIASEKGVIVEEIRMYQDNPMMHVEDVAEGLTFRGNALGRDIAGTVKSVRGLKRANLREFKDIHYHPDTMVLVVTGKTAGITRSLLNTAFGQHKSVRRTRPQPQKFVSTQAAPRAKIIQRPTDQVQVAITWPGVGRDHRDGPAVTLASIILGGTMSSRLFINVRDRQGLAYYIRASHTALAETGCFAIQAGFDRARWPAALASVSAEINRLADDGVSADELRRAQEFVRGKMALDLEDSAHVADWYAKQALLSKKLKSPADRLEEILAVRPADIQRVTRQFLRAKLASIAVIGPVTPTTKLPRVGVN